MRFKLYMQTEKEVAEANFQAGRKMAGINKFADCSAQELKRQLGFNPELARH